MYNDSEIFIGIDPRGIKDFNKFSSVSTCTQLSLPELPVIFQSKLSQLVTPVFL